MIAVRHSGHRILHGLKLGGAIRVGVIMGSGTALVQGGPLGLCLGYVFVGLVCYLVMIALGKMSAFLLHKKGLCDALCGSCVWLCCWLELPHEISRYPS